MVDTSTFPTVFGALKDILIPYSKNMVIKHDDVDNFYIETSFIMKNKKPMYFGSVKIGKNYVSFHLMPVYVFPRMLENISKDLRCRMQGKSCFNFKSIDVALFSELRELTESGFALYDAEGYL